MKKTLLLLLALCCLTLPAQAEGFYDLLPDHWAAPQIQEALDAGVVNGYGDGSFQPGRDVTAAQFCAILSRSFLSEESASAPEGKYQTMDACLPVLEGTSVERAYRNLGKVWSHYVNQPLSRYDMAQIVYNLLDQWDCLPDGAAQEDSARSIADWDKIPEYYRPAVSACCAGGILRGQSDGCFDGSESLNRAQACVIWSRLDALLNGPQETEAEPPEEDPVPAVEMPTFGLQGDETVQQMMNRVNAATPRCEEGRLPNGKLKTEENILELLELVKEGCPDGTVWSSTVRYDYKSPRLSPMKGCLSFGLAVSDFVFGEETPYTQTRGLPSLSVGDVVYIHYDNVDRVLILTGVNEEEDTYTACELENDKVNWSEWGPLSGLVDAPDFTTVYSRHS